MRQRWADENPDVLMRLVRAHRRAADFVEDANNRDEVAALLAAPNRIGVEAEVIRRTLDGRLKVSPDGAYRTDARYLLVGRAGAARPDPRAGGVALRADGALGTGAALARDARRRQGGVPPRPLRCGAGGAGRAAAGEPADGIGAFAGPAVRSRQHRGASRRVDDQATARGLTALTARPTPAASFLEVVPTLGSAALQLIGGQTMDEFTLNSTTTGDQDQPSVAGLRGTQFVAVWRNASTQDIRGRLFGVNGIASSPEFNIALPQATGTKRQLPTVIETNFGFAVAWIEQLPGGAPQLKVRAFDADTLSGEESSGKQL